MARKKRSVVRDTDYVNLIMELAPDDCFRQCNFAGCEFVGIGGATFDACTFVDCDCEWLGKRQFTFSCCQFGFTAGGDDEEELIDEC